MNVILLAPTPPPHGGIAGWTERMINTKLKNGWKVVVVDEKVSRNRDAYNESKKNILDEAKRCFRIWKGLNNALANEESKVVQACIPAGITSMLREIISAIITKVYKRKFIVHFRCTLPNMIKSNTQLLVFKILLSFSDEVFVLNNASAEYLKKVYPTKAYKVIPNFIETTSLIKRKKYGSELKKLVYVGGVIEEKGCDFIAEIAKKMPDKDFYLIGNIGMDTTGFSNNVHLCGEQPKEFVQKELESSDVFLFFSRYKGEGFSNALAEAMAHSLPCIVSDWAANLDMIENEGGIVLKNYNIEEAIEAIKKLEKLEIRKKMGLWNYNKIVNSYSDTIITGMYVDAYENILK